MTAFDDPLDDFYRRFPDLRQLDQEIAADETVLAPLADAISTVRALDRKAGDITLPQAERDVAKAEAATARTILRGVRAALAASLADEDAS